MKTKSLFWVSLLTALALAGCAKDRTTDDARADKVNQEAAALDSVSGTYRGSLVSHGAPIAGFTFVVGRSMITIAGSGSDASAQQQVVLTGNLTIATNGQDNKILNFKNGSYYSETQSFSVNIPVGSSASGSNGTITVSGNFSDNTLNGTIDADNYPDTAASFELAKDGPLPSANSLSNSDIYQTSNTMLIYQGRPKFADGGKPETVGLTILDSSATDPTQAFYNFFLPVKTVVATIRMQSGTLVTLNNVGWDLRSGTLEGTFSATPTGGVDAGALALSCHAAPGSQPSSWNCSLYNQSSLVFSGIFSLSKHAK